MATMNMIQALNSAMDVMLSKNPDVLIFGEDVGFFGGVFRATDGLQKKHGLQRCFDAPISEGHGEPEKVLRNPSQGPLSHHRD